MAVSRDMVGAGLGSTVQHQAVRRLGFLAAAFVFGATLATMLMPFREPIVGGLRDGMNRPVWVIAVVFILSAGQWALTHSPALSVQRKLDAGLVWLFCMCTAAAIYRHWLPYEDSDIFRGVSVISLGVLAFAAIVPVQPRKLALTALGCALVDPAVLVATQWLGNPMPKAEIWVWLFGPQFAAIAMAIAASHVLYNLGRSLTVARELGAYQLVRRLGAGAMGEVWLARHHTLARPAAIKLIRPDVEAASIRARQRFEDEAQAIARLESPNTVAIYDFGITDDGTLFYVMERLDGMDLQTALERGGPFLPERVIHLCIQACHSLEEAHHVGLIHRDIKPANLFVCRRGLEVDVLKVLDFGLVHALETGSTASVIEGTPAFLAPEAMSGKVDARSDLYSLACTAFTLLTGRPVFAYDSVEALIQAHVHETAPRASEFVTLPSALDDLLALCLDKDPDARPVDCAALRHALTNLPLDQDWTPARAQEWWGSHGETKLPEAPSQAPLTLAKTWFSTY